MATAPLVADEFDLNDPEGTALAIISLPEEDRIQALKDLALRGRAGTGSVFAEVLTLTEEDFFENSEAETILLSTFEFQANEKHLPQARTAAKSNHRTTRKLAARLLGLCGHPNAASDLTKLLAEENDFVRRSAIAGLRDLATEKAAAVLTTFAANSKFKEEIDAAQSAADRIRANLKRSKDPEFSYVPDFSVETEHVKWAKPLARKPRVLFLMERAVLRDLVELCQRMDIDWNYVDLLSRPTGDKEGDFNILEIHDEVREVILDRLEKPWDVIVVTTILSGSRSLNGSTTKKEGRIGWDSMPSEVRRGILKKAAGGTGLVLMNNGGYLSSTSFALGMPVPIPKDGGFHSWPSEISLRKFGRGRVALFPRKQEARLWSGGGGVVRAFRNLFPLGNAFQVPALPKQSRQVYPSEDFFFAAYCRAILWAARHKFSAHFKNARLDAKQGESAELTIQLEGELPARSQLHIEIANTYNETVQSWRGLAKTKLSIPFKPLLAGGVMVRAQLLGEDSTVINWAAFPAEVLGEARIAEILTPAMPVNPTIPLKAEARLQGGPPGDSILRAELTDTWDRRLSTQKIPTQGRKTIPIKFTHGKLLSRLVTLTVTLERADGHPLHSVRQPIVVASQDDFQDVPWLNWGADAYIETWAKLRPVYVAHPKLETLEAGVDIEGLQPLPSHSAGTFSQDGIRRPCLTSAKWELQLEDVTGNAGRQVAPLDCKIFLLSDETDLGGEYCFSPTCLDEFRRYLKAEYGSIKGLNASWNTQHKEWDEIIPRRMKEMKDWSHPGPWMDHRIFQDRVYTGMYDRVQTILRTHIPDARAGSSTTGTLDQWLFARRQGFAALFVGIRYRHEEMSFRPADQLLGGWFRPGYRFASLEDEAGTWFWGWDQILHGASMILTWVGEYGFNYPMMRGDLAPDRILLNTRKMVDDIQSGYGRLLLGATRRAGDYGVYYSPRSTLTATALEQNGKKRPVSVFGVRYDADMMFRFPRRIAYAEVEMGYLKKAPPKILYLPNIFSLSSLEIAELKNYVQQGGILLANSEPGICDEHGVRRKQWPFKEVFGLKLKKPTQSTKLPIEPMKMSGPIQGIDLTHLKLKLSPNAISQTVEAVEAKPLFQVGKVTAGFVHAYGKGLAIYFDFDPTRPEWNGEAIGTSNPHQAILNQLFKARGIRRGYEVEWDVKPEMLKGRPAYTLAEFTDNTSRYLCFLRNGTGSLKEQSSEKVGLKLDQPAFVYDPRSAAFLGHSNKIQFEFQRGKPHFISLLPYRVTGIEVQAKPASAGQTALVTAQVSIDGKQAGRHVFALRVHQPDGSEARWFRENVDTANGSFERRLPLSLNATPGVWRVSVRDVATGRTAESSFVVGKPEK